MGEDKTKLSLAPKNMPLKGNVRAPTSSLGIEKLFQISPSLFTS